MRLRKVKPSEIMVPEVRVTARFDDDTLIQFKKSIADAGQVAPIICSLIDGQFVLVDGLHRLNEALANKRESIDVAVIEGDMVDVLCKNIYLDHLRGKTPVSEMVNVIETLWKEYQLDSEKIAEKTGMSRDYIEKLQSISQLTPLIRAALDDEKVKVGHAYALTKLKDPIKQEMVFHQLMLYHWTVKELEQYIEDVLKIVEEQAASSSQQAERPPAKIKCAFCGGEFSPFEIANPNTCRACSGIMFASMVQAQREVAEDKSSTEDSAKVPKE